MVTYVTRIEDVRIVVIRTTTTMESVQDFEEKVTFFNTGENGDDSVLRKDHGVSYSKLPGRTK